MNELITKEKPIIESMIYEIRGKQVMLDSDLAQLYQCSNKTKSINLAVKRNINRFPSDFYFQLTKEETEKIHSRFQNETLKTKQGYNTKYLPYVFTEEGVAMLASVLHTKVAEEASVQIMRAFVRMKTYMSSNLIEQKHINNLVLEDHSKIKQLETYFHKFEEKKETNEIYFNGKIYDAYSIIIDIFKEAKSELIIIDRYTDKTFLDMIKNLKCKVILITSKNTKITKLDIEKYKKTYNNLIIVYDETYHDRYFIIDKNKIYHSGNSINNIGYRKSSINILEDKRIKESITNDVEIIISSQHLFL